MLEQNLDQETGVLSLTLARPPVNALNPALYDAIHEALVFAGHHQDVKSVVFQAHPGKAFCAGADIKAFSHLPDHEAEQRQLALVLRCLQDIVSCPKPTLAAISAPAIGAGLMLASACDEIVMTDQAWVSLPEIELALPTPIGAVIVGRRIRLAAVHALLQRAERFDAKQCLAQGLVDVVVTQDELANEVGLRLGVYTRLDGSVFAINKRWMNRDLVQLLEQATQTAHLT